MKVKAHRHIPKRIEDIHICKNLYMSVHSSIFHYSQKVEVTRVSIDGVDKQNVVCV